MSTIINIDNVLESVVIFPAAWMTVPSTCTIRSFILTSAHAMHFTSQGRRCTVYVTWFLSIQAVALTMMMLMMMVMLIYISPPTPLASGSSGWLEAFACARFYLFCAFVTITVPVGGGSSNGKITAKKKHIFYQCKRVEKKHARE